MNIDQIAMCYISMDSSWQVLQTNLKLFPNFEFVFELPIGRNPKNIHWITRLGIGMQARWGRHLSWSACVLVDGWSPSELPTLTQDENHIGCAMAAKLRTIERLDLEPNPGPRSGWRRNKMRENMTRMRERRRRRRGRERRPEPRRREKIDTTQLHSYGE